MYALCKNGGLFPFRFQHTIPYFPLNQRKNTANHSRRNAMKIKENMYTVLDYY